MRKSPLTIQESVVATRCRGGGRRLMVLINTPVNSDFIIIIIYYLFGANIYINIFTCALHEIGRAHV